jgi:ubiquitin
MLQWNDGSWEHRAYWGANLVSWGTDGTVSRRYMGALPALGQWVRLEVPAAQVGLEGRTLNGMAFTLYGGRATWDAAGKASATSPQTYQVSGTVALSGVGLGGVTLTATGGVSCGSTTGAGTYSCTVPSGWTGTVTPALVGYTFTPGSRSYSNVTANAMAQDYVAVGATATAWVEDAVPLGAMVGGDGEGWTWAGSNPAPYSGSLAHQSAVVAGMHQHYFYNATTTLAVGVGDTLFAYVYLDPANPPSQVMLQWNDGSWEHRAYWGANLVPWGTDGTVSRWYMGALPALGQWVRLEVTAAQVGLEGRTLNGMAFTLYGGRATWDAAGKAASAP